VTAVNLSEEEVIRAIQAVSPPRPDVVCGIGDDGAVLEPPAGRRLVSVLDTLNEGVHFPAGTEPKAIGYRVLAVNLSDLAAMGAEPAWAEISVSVPAADANWVTAFVEGLGDLARRWRMAIVGGDTVRGPLSVAAHLTGFIEPGRMLTRAGARPGDLLFVTGAPGEALAGLELLRAGSPDSRLIRRFMWPEPRVAEGRTLGGIASAAIDLSDGLATDAGRVAHASGVRVVVEADLLPLASELQEQFGEDRALEIAITGGDDYELCFTLPPGRQNELQDAASAWGCPCTRIGRVEEGRGLDFEFHGRPFTPDTSCRWDHFSEGSG
jgi:thiamine-monophosphate kinase